VRAVSLLIEATGFDQPNQIVGFPEWVVADRFDVNAKASGDANVPTLRRMLLNLFVDRFALRYHIESRPFEVLALVRAGEAGRPRPGLRPPTVDCAPWAAAILRGEQATRPPNPSADRPSCAIRLTRVTPDATLLRLTGAGADSRQLLDMLDSYARTAAGLQMIPVVDHAGLDRFDLDMVFSPQFAPSIAPNDAPEGQLLFDAMRDQLGLTFEKRTEMLDVMVIDHIARPTPN
jgi:uncharacterized protein (TIGR03435 family)